MERNEDGPEIAKKHELENGGMEKNEHDTGFVAAVHNVAPPQILVP
jgi:hypothetical protein